MISIVMFLLSGCGGGSGPGGINPPNENYQVTVHLSLSQVVEGEKVTCWVEISPNPPAGTVTWGQEPRSPSGIFSPLTGERVDWLAPTVEEASTFSIIASFTIMGREFSGSATIVVLPKGAPPQSPPSISLEYPTSEQIVGSGTLLTILGSVSQGSNPLKELVVLDSDGPLLQKWPISSAGAFRVDLSNFGSPGRKVIRVRAVDSVGLYGEAQIVVDNDDNLLDEKAREFLRKYCVRGDGTTRRFGDLTDGPFNVSVKIYLASGVQPYANIVKEAVDFLERYYSGMQFEIYTQEAFTKYPYITIKDEFSQNPGMTAATIVGYDPSNLNKIIYGEITLYQDWQLNENEYQKIRTVAHEISHVICTTSEVTDYGVYFVLWPYGPLEIQKVVIPPIVQLGIKKLYSNPPAWTP
jgi:hypothetical protein